MLEIRTKFGSFYNFTDLLHYMKDELITEVTYEVYYIFDKFVKTHLTLAELEEKVASKQLS